MTTTITAVTKVDIAQAIVEKQAQKAQLKDQAGGIMHQVIELGQEILALESKLYKENRRAKRS